METATSTTTTTTTTPTGEGTSASSGAAEGQATEPTEPTSTGQAEGAEGVSEGGEGGEGGETAEGEKKPAAEAPAPRLAVAKKMLEQAQAKEDKAAASMAEAEAYKAKLKEIGETWGQEIQAIRQAREAVSRGSHLAAAKLLGIDLRAAAKELIQAGGAEGQGGESDDDRPLTRKQVDEYLAKKEQEKKAAEEAAQKKTAEEKRASLRQQEVTFFGYVKGASNSAALLGALGDSAEPLILRDAYVAKAELEADAKPYTLQDLVAKTDEKVGARLAKLRGGATAPVAPAAAPPAAVSNRTAASKGPSSGKALTTDERWDQAFKELGPLIKR